MAKNFKKIKGLGFFFFLGGGGGGRSVVFFLRVGEEQGNNDIPGIFLFTLMSSNTT